MEFDNAILQMPNRIKRTLQFIPDDIKQKCEEIRLRVGLPVCLTINGRVVFVGENSAVSDALPPNPIIATKNCINETLALLCNNSIYLHENEIKQGFISLKNGNRAGVCGVFNADGMLISALSINIRIARQIYGCAKDILPYAEGGILIAGPPGSGKTTMLRDLVRQLSNGENGTYYRVTAIDSRGEISGSGTLDLGINTDVLYTSDKAIGTQIALRTMFPNFIAFDEIGTEKELSSINDCFNAGVGIITTVHCNEEKDIFTRELVCKILKSGAVKNVVLLSHTVGDTPKIFKNTEIKNCVYT